MKLEYLTHTAELLGLELESVENGIVIDNVLIKLSGRNVALFNNVTGEFLEGIMYDDPVSMCGFVFYMLSKYSEEINI